MTSSNDIVEKFLKNLENEGEIPFEKLEDLEKALINSDSKEIIEIIKKIN